MTHAALHIIANNCSIKQWFITNAIGLSKISEYSFSKLTNISPRYDAQLLHSRPIAVKTAIPTLYDTIHTTVFNDVTRLFVTYSWVSNANLHKKFVNFGCFN